MVVTGGEMVVTGGETVRQMVVTGDEECTVVGLVSRNQTLKEESAGWRDYGGPPVERWWWLVVLLKRRLAVDL